LALPLGAQRAPVAVRSDAASLSPLSAEQFAEVVTELSEPGGYFDTDNLISNERSYLHVMGVLDRLPVRGGAYVGVGPDQSFSYIARMRADVAFLLDIRRDNLLQHLLFKALFAQSRTRADYLALLLGLPAPRTTVPWLGSSIVELVAHVDSLVPSLASRTAAQRAVQRELAALRVPLSTADRATIARLHGEFMRGGLSLRFTSLGRAPRPYYPTLRDLLLETDRRGRRANYLATEADFQFVKELERRNLVIPVVGDLAGPTALRGIGDWLTTHEQPVRVLYTSNAEDYVLRDGGFRQYAASVMALPRAPNSVIIRSWFGGYQSHPNAVPGYFSVQLAQSFETFVQATADATPWSYGALVFGPHLEP
jgi:hypothetical protein